MDIKITMINGTVYDVSNEQGTFKEFMERNAGGIFSSFNGDNGKKFSIKVDHIMEVREVTKEIVK